MVTQVTEGVEISVTSSFEDEFSVVQNADFVYSYEISIRNENEFPVQLLSRKWYVQDSSGELIEVEGEGVVGEQPELQPGEEYHYDSGTSLSTGFGKMYGYYVMQNSFTEETFKVFIPEFKLVADFCLN